MKRYLTGLLLLTLVMVLLAFAVKWAAMPFFAPLPDWMLPLAVLYFAATYAAQYWLTVTAVNKHPKIFIQQFLATTVGVLFLHLIVLAATLLTHPECGKRFAVAFLILYVVYTVYMVFALVRYVRNASSK